MNAELLKTLGLIVICAATGMLLKVFSPAFSPLLSAVAGVSVIGVCVFYLFPVIEYFIEISQNTSFGGFSGILLKVCGIGIISKLCSDFCRDCGQNSYAAKAEFVGKTAIILVIMPVIKILFEQIKEFLN